MKAVCSVPTCTRVARSLGWCEAHYTRHLRHGDVMADEPIGPPHSGTRKWYGTPRAAAGPFDLEDLEEL